ncbi:FecCD family ABC transporter permease [Gynuella sunshinyii]|uniref:ABC-type Fe3+-siderophore transport system, permease component n=1 Tax=Gynuella sunshinyii YC6258 TaxID=1445510 RepID=A0A0C5VIF4_9GAMM|nr:iron ABC transporter permease [Gynuella sunshinyii]AJQ94046.1 ABC-type Fe3+-siderophore transport system, permease component [Gynuella sunshinyii YC6258]
MKPRRAQLWHHVLLLVLLMVLMGFALTIGSSGIALGEVLQTLFSSNPVSDDIRVIILQVRLPRVCLAAIIGALLGISGTAIQGLFRNPLAEPSILGVTSGASLVTMIMLIMFPSLITTLGQWLGTFVIPLIACTGALIAMLMVLLIQGQQSGSSANLILAGIAVNLIAGAGISLSAYLATDHQLRSLTFWALGTLSAASWPRVLVTGLTLAMVLPALILSAKALNVMLLGDSEARHMGFNIQRTRRVIIVLSSLAIASAVGFTGNIGFIGLVIPHINRMMFGPQHQHLFPLTALTGAALLVLADCLARVIIAPAEIPVGIITACIGGPFFIFLLIKNRRLTV